MNHPATDALALTSPDARFPTLVFDMDFRSPGAAITNLSAELMEIRNASGQLFGWVINAGLQGNPRHKNVLLIPRVGLRMQCDLYDTTGAYICTGMHRNVGSLQNGTRALHIRPPFMVELRQSWWPTWGRDFHSVWLFTPQQQWSRDEPHDQLEWDFFEIGTAATWLDDYPDNANYYNGDITSNAHIWQVGSRVRYEPPQLRTRIGPGHTPWPTSLCNPYPPINGGRMLNWRLYIYRRAGGKISPSGTPYRELWLNGQEVYGPTVNSSKADLWAWSAANWKMAPPGNSTPRDVLDRRFDESYHLMYAVHNIEFFAGDNNTIPGRTKGNAYSITEYIRVWTI